MPSVLVRSLPSSGWQGGCQQGGACPDTVTPPAASSIEAERVVDVDSKASGKTGEAGQGPPTRAMVGDILQAQQAHLGILSPVHIQGLEQLPGKTLYSPTAPAS